MKGWGRGEGGEKEIVFVNYFSAIIIFAPTRSRSGAFLLERDKHMQRDISNDHKRFADRPVEFRTKKSSSF